MKKEYQYPRVKVVEVEADAPIMQIYSGGDDDPIFG